MERVTSRPWLPWDPLFPRPSRGKRHFPEHVHTPRFTLHARRPLSFFTGKGATPGEGGGPQRGPRLHTPKSRKCHTVLAFCPHRFMGILAPDPGRRGPTSPTRPLWPGQSRRAPWKRRREQVRSLSLPSPPTDPTCLCCPPMLPRSPQSHSAFRLPGGLLARGVPLGRPSGWLAEGPIPRRDPQ